jgi:hypothetical protein
VQHLEAAVVVDATGLGEAHLARGALEQANAEALLEGGHVLGDGGGRQAQIARGGGEPVAVGDADEDAQGLQGVHGGMLPLFRVWKESLSAWLDSRGRSALVA